jgi:hypothetical protein
MTRVAVVRKQEVLDLDNRTRGTREVEIFKRKLDLVFLAI